MSEHEADRDDEIVETAGDGRFVRFADKLGSGAFKTVYRGFDTERGIEVAWNQVLYERYNLDLSRVMNEIEVFKTIRNPHIIEFYHAWQDTDAKQVVFITELMPSGTLKQFTSRTPNVKLKVLKNWCMQILMGLDYLHSLQPPIIHRDIKCDNIFINGLSEGEVKIGDFGLATFSSREQGMSLAGTPEFMAPEFYSDQYSTAVDIWAFGMLVIELVTHEFPYSECRGIHQICGKVTNGIMPSQLQRITHPALVDFIALCLTVETESRPTARALLDHPFFELEADGDLAISDLLAPVPEPAVSEQAALNPGVVVMDTPVQHQPLALNTPYPQVQLDAAGYLSPPPEVSLLATVDEPAPQVHLDGYNSQPPLHQPETADPQLGYHSDMNAVGVSLAPVQLQPFQQQDLAYSEFGGQTDQSYASDHATYASDGAYASDTGYNSVSETFPSPLLDPENQKKDLVSAEVVYLNAVNAGDGQLGLRMNIVTSDGKEQHTDEVSFDFLLNSDTPSSIAVEMLRLFDLKESALPQLEATISERVFYLARNVSQDLPVQLEPDYQNDTLLVDSVVQQPAQVAFEPSAVPTGLAASASDLSRESSVDALAVPSTHTTQWIGGADLAVQQTPETQSGSSTPEPTLPDHPAAEATIPTPDTEDGYRVLATEVVCDDDDATKEASGDDSLGTPVVFADEDGSGSVVTMIDDEGEEGSSSSVEPLAVVKDSDSPLALVDSFLEMSPPSTHSQDESNALSANSQPSPQLTRRERSRPRSHTSPMVVPVAIADQASATSPGIPSVFASPFPDNYRLLRAHHRRESSDLNSSFKFVLPPEEDDIEELESYLDEASPTKCSASSPTRGSTSDYSSLQNCEALSSTSTRSQAPRSTVAENSNSEPDHYDYFTDEGVPDNCDIFIDGLTDGEEEDEEEDREMMRLRAKQQLELQRLIHAHERELAAAKQSRKESRLRRSSVLKRKNAHLAGSATPVLSDDEGYRSAAMASINRSFSMPPGEVLNNIDESSETGSAG